MLVWYPHHPGSCLGSGQRVRAGAGSPVPVLTRWAASPSASSPGARRTSGPASCPGAGQIRRRPGSGPTPRPSDLVRATQLVGSARDDGRRASEPTSLRHVASGASQPTSLTMVRMVRATQLAGSSPAGCGSRRAGCRGRSSAARCGSSSAGCCGRSTQLTLGSQRCRPDPGPPRVLVAQPNRRWETAPRVTHPSRERRIDSRAYQKAA